METSKKIAFLDSSPGMMLKLEPNASPVWGMMTAQHMVEHLFSALLMSLKNTTYNMQTTGKLILRKKTDMLSNGFNPGISMGNLKDLVYPDLTSAINQYAVHLKDFLETISITILQTSHFYFGPFNNDEWLTFHYWHIHHHFKQFNIL